MPRKTGYVEIYGLYDPDTLELRYIGKANCKDARLKTHISDAKRKKSPLYSWVRKLKANGKIPAVKVLSLCEAGSWQNEERRLIEQHRSTGDRLLNVADGGDEPYCSPAVRAKNGARSARKRNKTVHSLICYFGRAARFSKNRNNQERMSKMLMAQRRLQSMGPQEQERFAEKWEQRRAG